MSEVPALPAATITLVREADRGFEVLMLQRNLKSAFVAGMYLFPGGGLDPEDDANTTAPLSAGLDDGAASAHLGLSSGGLAYWAAAIREAFEEAGVLLAYDASGALVDLSSDRMTQRFEAHRELLNAGKLRFCDMLASEGLKLAVDRMVYFSHWITPLPAPRRYDTRFFLAEAPAGQEPLHDNVEAISHLWVRPQEALDRHGAGTFKMRFPTLRTLEQFAQFDNLNTLMKHMRAQTDIPAWLPRITALGERVLPGDPRYDDYATVRQGAWKDE